MNIITRECLFEYQIQKLIKKFRIDYELKNLTAEELQDEIYKNLSKEFGIAVLEFINDFSGDELFQKEG